MLLSLLLILFFSLLLVSILSHFSAIATVIFFFGHLGVLPRGYLLLELKQPFPCLLLLLFQVGQLQLVALLLGEPESAPFSLIHRQLWQPIEEIVLVRQEWHRFKAALGLGPVVRITSMEVLMVRRQHFEDSQHPLRVGQLLLEELHGADDGFDAVLLCAILTISVANKVDDDLSDCFSNLNFWRGHRTKSRNCNFLCQGHPELAFSHQLHELKGHYRLLEGRHVVVVLDHAIIELLLVSSVESYLLDGNSSFDHKFKVSLLCAVVS